MIKVNVKKNNEEIKSILIEGHAGYSKKGTDIVCAAVSSIITTSINAILSFDDAIKVTDDGNILKIEVKKYDFITEKLLKNMLSLLKEVERDYQKNIKVEGE